MADPVFPGGRAVMFVAGDLKAARLLEPLAMLWIQLMVRRNLGRRFAFGLLRKGA